MSEPMTPDERAELRRLAGAAMKPGAQDGCCGTCGTAVAATEAYCDDCWSEGPEWRMGHLLGSRRFANAIPKLLDELEGAIVSGNLAKDAFEKMMAERDSLAERSAEHVKIIDYLFDKLESDPNYEVEHCAHCEQAWAGRHPTCRVTYTGKERDSLAAQVVALLVRLQEVMDATREATSVPLGPRIRLLIGDLLSADAAAVAAEWKRQERQAGARELLRRVTAKVPADARMTIPFHIELEAMEAEASQ